MKLTRRVGLALAILVFCAVGTAAEQAKTTSFYRGPSLFSTRPSETASVSSIDRFGPVGMGIELHQPAFVMKIQNIEEGSPAAATGKLKKGQIIETINGQKLADIDPRIQLAQILDAAEAADGVLKFMVKNTADAKAEEVIVKIPVLGAYSKTWPLKCPKSARIVRAYGDYLATKPSGGTGLNGFQLLFLLSTGEDKDLDTARRWVKSIVAGCKNGGGVSNYAWFIGISGTPLAEYYLRTGDESVLPVLKAYANITGQFAEDFAKGEVTVAATTFLRYSSKGVVQKPRVPQGIFSIWLEEMKLPPLDDEAMRKSATVIPMLTSAWQAKQDPDTTEVQGEEDLFIHDGKFVANPRLLGTWKAVDQVNTIDEFTPEQAAPKKGAGKKAAGKKTTKAGRSNITEITFKDNGLTGDPMLIWSGHTLMDLDRYQAMKMTVKKIGGSDYLFVETGGFSEKNPVGWKTPLYVMKRQAK
jgi:hypothetical protein